MPARRRTRLQAQPPDFGPPQLTKLSDYAPEGDRWAHEIKFDGYRLAAGIVGKDVRLLTGTGLDWSDKYKSIVEALARLPVKNAYIDGEICVLNPDGTTSFAALQAATDHKEAQARRANPISHVHRRRALALGLREDKPPRAIMYERRTRR